MLLIKGTFDVKDQMESILSSVDLKHEALLLLLDNWKEYLFNDSKHFKEIFKKFKTINNLLGRSKDVLTNKYDLMQYFSKTKNSHGLPSIVFKHFNESTIQAFLKSGSKHKFLKASDGFAGKGITVVNSIEEIKEFIDLYKPSRAFQGWILQDALEDISTFQGYKFHIRVLITVTVCNESVSVCIGNMHFYRFSKDTYNKSKLKEKDTYNTHRKTNSKNSFFPMELPDGWTAADAKNAMKTINKTFRSLFQNQHAFLPDWKIKNGYDILGVDIVFDTKHKMYILEINKKIGLGLENIVNIPEIFHLGLGGAPLKLFTCIYGTPEGRTTPFTKPLTTFYETTYKNSLEVNDAFKSLFHIPLEEEADRGYFEYQKMSKPKNRTLRAKSKLTGSKTLKRGSKK